MRRVKQAAIGLAALLTATFAATAATQHDNFVYFALAGVQSFNFVETDHSITSKQPYGGTTAGVSQAGNGSGSGKRRSRGSPTSLSVGQVPSGASPLMA